MVILFESNHAGNLIQFLNDISAYSIKDETMINAIYYYRPDITVLKVYDLNSLHRQAVRHSQNILQ